MSQDMINYFIMTLFLYTERQDHEIELKKYVLILPSLSISQTSLWFSHAQNGCYSLADS